MSTADAIQIAAALLSFVGAFMGAWWRISSRVHSLLASQEEIVRALANLRTELAFATRRQSQIAEKTGIRLNTLEKELSNLSVIMVEREKRI